MRLVGTGKDPDHKYPEGLVFDAPPHAARKMVDGGYATVLDPKDDPARTESQIAAAVQRGDSLSDSVDHELASGMSESDALEVVQGGPVDEPVPGGAEARAPVGVGTEQLPDSPAPGSESSASTSSSSSSSSSTSTSSSDELTPKQQAVQKAKDLDISYSGSQAQIEERIAAKEAELEEQNAPASDELVQRAEDLELDSSGTTAEVQARIAAREQELAEQGASS